MPIGPHVDGAGVTAAFGWNSAMPPGVAVFERGGGAENRAWRTSPRLVSIARASGVADGDGGYSVMSDRAGAAARHAAMTPNEMVTVTLRDARIVPPGVDWHPGTARRVASGGTCHLDDGASCSRRSSEARDPAVFGATRRAVALGAGVGEDERRASRG
jgi:hypothetical protein